MCYFVVYEYSGCGAQGRNAFRLAATTVLSVDTVAHTNPWRDTATDLVIYLDEVSRNEIGTGQRCGGGDDR